jgi:hypothetical protein
MQWAKDATMVRAAAEGWTHDDCVAAMFQFSLLSFMSQTDNGMERYLHNAPWNDWIPPSQSRMRFQAAQANRTPAQHERCVRARLCSVDNLGLSRVVFATVRKNASAQMCLCLRRGADVLALMEIEVLDAVHVGNRLIRLSPSGGHFPTVFLSFDNDSRVTKFCEMLIVS